MNDPGSKITPHVVIVGGGFGGLSAALGLKNAQVRITLIDRRNFHLFQPLLYQVATGWLSPANIASTLRAALKRQNNTRVLLAEILGFDVKRRRVIIESAEIDYDFLIIATGSHHHYFGNERWQHLAPGLKTIEDATRIRNRIFSALEAAERENDSTKRQALLTFAIVGGGPTGVELAGALGEIARDILTRDFRRIDPSQTCIMLIEAGERILPSYSATLSSKASNSLEELGVTVRTHSTVIDITDRILTIKHHTGEGENIACHTVIWAAGVQASPLGESLHADTHAKIDRAGRVEVKPDLAIADHPEIFVIGDLANFMHQTGKPLPGVAPVAIQEGRYVARAIMARVHNKPIPPPFRYRDRGSMAIIGRASAVAQIGPWEFSGYFAWLAWLFVHLAALIEFENRVLVLVQWGWYYFARNRAARLITGEPSASSQSQACRDERNSA